MENHLLFLEIMYDQFLIEVFHLLLILLNNFGKVIKKIFIINLGIHGDQFDRFLRVLIFIKVILLVNVLLEN
jgi:hypothetical protein